jgi:tetratricopeptide (TPR) repeat protein
MTVDSEHEASLIPEGTQTGEPVEGETPAAPEGTLTCEIGQPAEPQISQAQNADQPRLLPQWVRIGVGLVVLVVLVVLAYPNLQDWFQPRDKAPTRPVAQVEQAVTANPDDAQAHYDLASVHYQAGRFEDAWAQLHAVPAYVAAVQASPELAQAEKAVQNAPNSKEAHFKLGTLWARAGLFALAETAFKQAIALDSRYVDAYVNLGVVYYQMGRLADALAQYDTALAINPNDADVHHNKGAVYVQQALQTTPPDESLLDKGVEEFKRALAINPNLFQASFSLGVVYDLRGQKEEALAMFKRFQELDDGSDPQATESARAYIQKLSQ